MKTSAELSAHKLTKPIQLPAAWLTGLVLVEIVFLAAAAKITAPWWAAGALVVAAIIYVPIFLRAIFLLQTKYRPEMQDDPYYQDHLKSLTGGSPIEPVTIDYADLPEDSDVEPGPGELRIRSHAPKAILSAKWDGSIVAVNKLRPDFVTILKDLKKERIPVAQTFGIRQTPMAPELRVVVGLNVTFSEIKKILAAVGSGYHGIIRFSWWDEEPGDFDNTVLIGA